jgi:hypothetical protein
LYFVPELSRATGSGKLESIIEGVNVLEYHIRPQVSSNFIENAFLFVIALFPYHIKERGATSPFRWVLSHKGFPEKTFVPFC